MLQPLRTPSSSRSKELAVSALGAVGESEAGGGHLGFTPFTHSRCLWQVIPAYPPALSLSSHPQPRLPRPPCCPTSPPSWSICGSSC